MAELPSNAQQDKVAEPTEQPVTTPALASPKPQADNSKKNPINNEQNYYERLGVSRTADDAAIKKAYYAEALKYHPDTNKGDEVAATKRFQLVGEAYEGIKNEEQRIIYDYTLFKPEAKTTNEDSGPVFQRQSAEGSTAPQAPMSEGNSVGDNAQMSDAVVPYTPPSDDQVESLNAQRPSETDDQVESVNPQRQSENDAQPSAGLIIAVAGAHMDEASMELIILVLFLLMHLLKNSLTAAGPQEQAGANANASLSEEPSGMRGSMMARPPDTESTPLALKEKPAQSVISEQSTKAAIPAGSSSSVALQAPKNSPPPSTATETPLRIK